MGSTTMRGQFFARQAVEETARLIPGSSLRIYEGRDHVGALQDERLPADVLEFMTRSAGLASGEPASEAPPEPVVAEA